MDNLKYFKHDSNARNDLKLAKIQKKYGILGYGIYFCIIEMLCSSNNYEVKYDLELISYLLKEDVKIIEDIVKNYNLFKIKNGKFYSESLKERMASLDKIREGWKNGGKNRWKTVEEPKRSAGYTREEGMKMQ